MEINFNYLNDKHLNENCLILGSGPTMNQFDFMGFKGKIIFIGTTILRIKNIKPDYLVSGNNIFPVVNIKEHLNFLNSFKNMTWLMSDTCCYQDIWPYDERLFKKLKIDYLKFDDRHFNKKYCNPKKKCCDLIDIKLNNTNLVNEIEKKYEIPYNFTHIQGASVFDSALLFCVLMGFKNIYIQGVDLPKSHYQRGGYGGNYFGHSSKEADKVIQNALKITKYKYLYYYIKRFEFKPYYDSLKLRLKIFFNKSYSIFNEDIEVSFKLYNWVSKISQSNNINIINLSKLSRLNEIKGFKYVETRDIK